MTNSLLVALVALFIAPALAAAQTPCVSAAPPAAERSSLARTTIIGFDGEPAEALIAVGRGTINTWADGPDDLTVTSGQRVRFCDDSESEMVVDMTHATLVTEQTGCGGARWRLVLHGQAVLAPGERNTRGRALSRNGRQRALHASIGDLLFVASVEPARIGPNEALALQVVAAQLHAVAGVVGWGLSRHEGAPAVKVLYYGNVPLRHELTSASGLPVVWTQVPRGAFEGQPCAATP